MSPKKGANKDPPGPPSGALGLGTFSVNFSQISIWQCQAVSVEQVFIKTARGPQGSLGLFDLLGLNLNTRTSRKASL